MQTQARAAALAFVACLVGGCANRAARPGGAEPVVIVGDGVKAKAADKPSADAKDDPSEARKKALSEAASFGVLGALGTGQDEGLASLFGTTPGGVVGGVVGGFGGLGTSGIGIGGGGGGGGTGEGFGMIGTLKGGAGYGHGYGQSRPNERVKARIEAATVTGPLTEEVVQRILADHREDVQDCYRLEAKRSSSHVRGKMTLAFTIDGAGRVDEVLVPESSFWSRELPSCVALVVGTFRFPTVPDGGVVKVLLPVTF